MSYIDSLRRGIVIVLVAYPLCGLASPVDEDRYKSFLQKKSAVDSEIADQVSKLETDFTAETAPLVQQESELKTARDLLLREYNEEADVGVGNFVVSWVLDAVKAKLAIPFFYLTVILALLYLFIRKRPIFLRYRVLITILASLLVVFYSLDLFAEDHRHPYGPEIDAKLTTVNRLLTADEIDRAIVVIEEAEKGLIELSLPEVSSTYLIPLETFKKGSFHEKYSLGCLYYENKDAAKATALFVDALKNLKTRKDDALLVLNILKYFEEVKDHKNAADTLVHLSTISKSQGALLAHLDIITLGPQQKQDILDALLKRMKTAVDYLAAAVYLSGHGNAEEASRMYGKAVATARDSAGYLGLADYAYKNGIEQEAVVAMDKAFKSARRTESLIEYTRLAKAHGLENAADAWDKAVSSAKSVHDYILLAKYSNEQQDKQKANEYLRESIGRKGSLADLLEAMNLAADMNNSALVAELIGSVLSNSKRFADFMAIAEVSRKLAADKLPEVVGYAAKAARKPSQFQSLVRFVVVAKDSGLINVVIESAQARLRHVKDIQKFREELVDKGFKSVVGPLNKAIVAKTRRSSGLMTLFTRFETEGFLDDAEAALSKLVSITSRTKKNREILKLALSKKMYKAAFDACVKLMKVKGSGAVPDPKLLPQSEYLPNGPDVDYPVYCAIIGQKAGRLADSRDILERHVAGYLDSYIHDPDSSIQGPVNSYFYLRLLWEMAGNSSLIAKYESVYKLVEEKYLEEYREERAEIVSEKQIELANRKTSMNEGIALLQTEIEDLTRKLAEIRQQNRKQIFKVVASFTRLAAVAILFLIATVIAAVVAFRFARSLTRFKISGFFFKFTEIFGFEMCFTIILLPAGLLLLIASQVSEMLLHLQQDSESSKLCDRLETSEVT